MGRVGQELGQEVGTGELGSRNGEAFERSYSGLGDNEGRSDAPVSMKLSHVYHCSVSILRGVAEAMECSVGDEFWAWRVLPRDGLRRERRQLTCPCLPLGDYVVRQQFVP